jgi:hypothetical protein
MSAYTVDDVLEMLDDIRNDLEPSARDAWWHALEKTDHFTLARDLEVDHGAAVIAASAFCPNRQGETDGLNVHGTLSPCAACTTIAIKALAA